MIELGTMTVRDQESVAEIRGKILGLVRGLDGPEVMAVRVATAVSEVARRSLASGGGARVGVALAGEGDVPVLHVRIEPNGSRIDAGPLRPFFDRVAASGSSDAGSVTATLGLPATGHQVDPAVIARERARIAAKSRAELMEELQLKNRELAAYNERLEATVAERTAELRSANSTMRRDLDAGAAYVRALIPPPTDGPVAIDWRYIPSSDLGGDTIGYHWIDEEHLALYLVDVTGHGLDSALLAVTITNVIRSGSLPKTDMRRPDQVVAALNEAFPGSRHGHKFFTFWFGVYHAPSRTLSWSGGGHHPSLLLVPGQEQAVSLEATGPIMGAVPGMDFPAESCDVPVGSRLLIYSDGVFEILRDDVLIWTLEESTAQIERLAVAGGPIMDALLEHARTLRGSSQLDDDFSIVEARFG